ncbi:hypothetical protein H6P81_010676 [Aristolochia fimbriata]|uniref:Uncharacterized protein n=1 Tax=Aristolochia fimbriata TaxID=158543 RepID=A0AAV7EQK3_ARIFI|nr:hypothetical protein H6P81_010676 [Aristolochia fimbriata]
MISAVKVLERRQVSPPPGSVPPATLSLTFFDGLWLPMLSLVRRLFFYDLPAGTSTDDFRRSHLPLLERSLSLALSVYYPLAGRFVRKPDSDLGDGVIRYSDGDSVSLTVAESDADFAGLVANRPKEAKEFHSLVPPLLPESSSNDMPLVAFQVTVFPGSGVAIGIVLNHVVADGKSSTDFMKSWASIANANGDVSAVKSIPVFDRTLVGDLEGLKRRFLEDAKKLAAAMGGAPPSESATEEARPVQLNRVIRSTFVLTRADIDKIRVKISSESKATSLKLSALVVTYAYVLHCAAKSRESPDQSAKNVYFGIMADSRPRLQPPVPGTYFGNCVVWRLTAADGGEVGGENGFAVAAEAIHGAIRELEDGVLKDAENLIWKWASLMKERLLTIAGSPRFGVYEMDFGWGRPRKAEIVSIEDNGAISLCDSRYEEGGIEIGMVGPEEEMSRFASAFEEGLRRLI